jgi:plasmid stabilization system protein ParE
MNVLFSPASLQDLSSIEEWLSQPGSGKAALSKRAAITQAIKELKQTAKVWPLLEGAEDKLTRKRVVVGHVIVYRIVDSGAKTDNFVIIDAVFAPGRFRG